MACAKVVAQISKPAVSPTSKSAGHVSLDTPQVWKPAIQQTWKSGLLVFAVRMTVRGGVGRKNNFVRSQGVAEAGERHFFVHVQRVEEGLELHLIGMIRHVAGIQQLHGKLAPARLV